MSQFRYKAFLSYSHCDKGSAAWLHRRLEGYRVPRRLVGESGSRGKIPARLSPVFKDRDELPSSADLGQEINAALAASEYLIVLCSPAAAQSSWVNAEVEEFVRLRDAEHVLCLVVGGEPAARESRDCPFPPAFAGREPIAADAREAGDGRSTAFLKIVAGLIGVGFDALRQRELQRRQRRLALITAASFAGFLLTSGLAVSAYLAQLEAESQRARAEAERSTSQRTADFMVDIFNVVDPAIARGREVTAKEVLDRGQAAIDRLADEPTVQANLLHTLGVVNVGIGEYDSAIELLTKALPLRQQHSDLLATETVLAEAFFLSGNLEQARVHFAGVVEQFEAGQLGWDRIASLAYNGLGEVLVALGDTTTAERYHQKALAEARTNWSGATPELGRSLHGLSLALLYQGRFDEARESVDQALATYQRALGPDHPRVLEAHNTLTTVYYASGDTQAAMQELQVAAEIFERVLGATHPSYASVLNNLGRLQLESGDPAVALTLLQQSVEIDRLHERDRHTDLVFSLNSLGLAYMVSGNTGAARRAFQEALALADTSGHRLAGVVRMHMASIDCARGEAGAGETLLPEAGRLIAQDYPADDWRAHYLHNVEAECMAAGIGTKAASAAVSRQAVEVIKGPDNLFSRLARERERRIAEGEQARAR